MAGQGIRRREVLRILGTAAAAAQFPGFSKWGFACGHVGNAALQIKPAIYHPQFFTAAEYRDGRATHGDHHSQRRHSGCKGSGRCGIYRFHDGKRSRGAIRVSRGTYLVERAS